jgi:hypothetical protein
VIVLETDQAIEQLDRLLSEVGLLLGEPPLSTVQLAPPAPDRTWAVVVQDQLTDLRTNALGLSELERADVFHTDPSLATRRAVLINGIAKVSTFVDIRLAPCLRELHSALLAAGMQSSVERVDALLQELDHTRLGLAPGRGVGAERVAAAVRGIGLLRTLSVPGVSQVLVDFEADFRATRNQIARMSTYKGLHDQLHHLQFDYFNFLDAHVGRMRASMQPTDEDYEFVSSYADRIREEVVERSREIAEGSALRPIEIAWIDELERICRTLGEGAGQHDLSPLARGLVGMDHLIGTRSEALNRWLIAIARLLPLDALEHALERVIELVGGTNDELPTLQTSLGALEEVHTGLDRLVDAHDTWQDVDRELRDIAAALLYDPSSVAQRWPEQNVRVLQLSAECTEEWAAKLMGVDAPRLQQLLKDSTADAPRVARAFRDYRTHAAKGFYNLDRALLEACTELGGLDAPLKDLLGHIQSTTMPMPA